MKKLFKRIRLKLGLFTRKELFDFATIMMKKCNGNFNEIWHADVENFIEDLNK